jgi:hypothetical protein
VNIDLNENSRPKIPLRVISPLFSINSPFIYKTQKQNVKSKWHRAGQAQMSSFPAIDVDKNSNPLNNKPL